MDFSLTEPGILLIDAGSQQLLRTGRRATLWRPEIEVCHDSRMMHVDGPDSCRTKLDQALSKSWCTNNLSLSLRRTSRLVLR